MEQFDESPGPREPSQPPTRRESLVPATAVTAVAIVAVIAAFTAKRAEDVPVPAARPVVAEAAKPTPAQKADVVHAPPLAPATNSMGGSAACKQCGVVQMVVAVYDRASKKEPRAYQMHIRMDDGTVRTIEQRGALAAGSRVLVDGNAVRPMS